MRKHGKRGISLILSVLLLFGMAGINGLWSAAAEEETLQEGEFEYVVLEDGTASITAYRGNARKVEFPSKVGEYPVTRVSSSFEGKESMTALILPEGIKAVEPHAFYGAENLHSVQFPESLVEIGLGAFGYCSNLTKAILPAGLQTIGENPFQNCSALTSIRFSEENEKYAVYRNLLYEKETRTIIGCAPGALEEHLVIPEGTAAIGAYAFSGTAIREVTFPDGLQTLGEWSFVHCDALREIHFARGLEKIQDFAFNDCMSLEEFRIPEGVTELGRRVFSDCSALRTVQIPESLTVMRENPFARCTALSELILPENHPVFECRDRFLIWKDWREIICHLPSPEDEVVTVPEAVTEIGAGAFEEDPYLKKVILPASTRIIDGGAFYFCTALECVVIQEGLETIGDSVFSRCSSLREITLPKTLTRIGYYAFDSCGSLTELDLPEGVKSLPNGLFDRCGSLTLTVHSDEHEAYCRKNNYSFVRAEEEPAAAEDKPVTLTDKYGDEFNVLPEVYAYTKGSLTLFTEDQAMRQILLRGVPLTSIGQETVNRGPCLVMEQEDGSRLILEECFTLEDAERWIPEESLIRFFRAVFGENYDYYLEEPADLMEGEPLETVLAESESARRERSEAALGYIRSLRVPYGSGENEWSLPGTNLFEGQSRRLIKKDEVTTWASMHGIVWGTGTPLNGWYTLKIIKDESRWGMLTMCPLGSDENHELAPEAWLSVFAARVTGKTELAEYSLRDSSDFTPVYAETLVVRGTPAELAYESFSGEEGKPFRVRVTLLEKPKGGSADFRWYYRMDDSEIYSLQSEGDSVSVTGRETVLETAVSPAGYVGLALPEYGLCSYFPVATGRELPSFTSSHLEAAVAGEPLHIRYAIHENGYPIAKAGIVIEADVNGTIETVGEFPLSELTGQVEFVPTEEMDWISGTIVIQFESGIAYTGDIRINQSVGGTKYHPEKVRIHIDREELRVGETATLTYEAENIKDLSTLRFWIINYTENCNFRFTADHSNAQDLEAASSGTVQITPEEAGILDLSILFVDSEGYDSGAGIFGVRVTE